MQWRLQTKDQHEVKAPLAFCTIQDEHAAGRIHNLRQAHSFWGLLIYNRGACVEARFNVVSVVASGCLEVSRIGEFKDFQLTEKNVEDLLARGVILRDVMLVGRQVRSEYTWKVDLVALRKNGDLVVIEVKRDQADMAARKEPCEIQAIRYAAGLTEIRSAEDIVDAMYSSFCNGRQDLGADDAERRQLLKDEIENFINPKAQINSRQELMLVASGFDPGTISACHWLYNNGITISCVQISPFKNLNEEGTVLLVVDRVFPLESIQDLKNRAVGRRLRAVSGDARARFASTFDMLDSGLIRAGQTVCLKGTDKTAQVLDGEFVLDGTDRLRWNEWAKKYKTGSFSLYHYVTVDSLSGNTLHEVRTER